jgi:hypothetical protein
MQARTAVLAVLADVVAVLVFAAVGRLSHAESGDLVGLLATAAPFLVGVAASWALPPVRRAPAALQAGVAVWLGALLLGLLIRTLFTRSLPLTFVLVAAVTLAALLIGWRALALLVARRARSDSGAR